jgi:hypothetical protein
MKALLATVIVAVTLASPARSAPTDDTFSGWDWLGATLSGALVGNGAALGLGALGASLDRSTAGVIQDGGALGTQQGWPAEQAQELERMGPS